MTSFLSLADNEECMDSKRRAQKDAIWICVWVCICAWGWDWDGPKGVERVCWWRLLVRVQNMLHRRRRSKNLLISTFALLPLPLPDLFLFLLQSLSRPCPYPSHARRRERSWNGSSRRTRSQSCRCSGRQMMSMSATRGHWSGVLTPSYLSYW